jgi:hypothetical protein
VADFVAVSVTAGRYVFLAKIACTRFFCSSVLFLVGIVLIARWQPPRVPG